VNAMTLILTKTMVSGDRKFQITKLSDEAWEVSVLPVDFIGDPPTGAHSFTSQASALVHLNDLVARADYGQTVPFTTPVQYQHNRDVPRDC
jgi:hypothetical protein